VHRRGDRLVGTFAPTLAGASRTISTALNRRTKHDILGCVGYATRGLLLQLKTKRLVGVENELGLITWIKISRNNLN